MLPRVSLWKKTCLQRQYIVFLFLPGALMDKSRKKFAWGIGVGCVFQCCLPFYLAFLVLLSIFSSISFIFALFILSSSSLRGLLDYLSRFVLFVRSSALRPFHPVGPLGCLLFLSSPLLLIAFLLQSSPSHILSSSSLLCSFSPVPFSLLRSNAFIIQVFSHQSAHATVFWVWVSWFSMHSLGSWGYSAKQALCIVSLCLCVLILHTSFLLGKGIQLFCTTTLLYSTDFRQTRVLHNHVFGRQQRIYAAKRLHNWRLCNNVITQCD